MFNTKTSKAIKEGLFPPPEKNGILSCAILGTFYFVQKSPVHTVSDSTVEAQVPQTDKQKKRIIYIYGLKLFSLS